MTGPSYGELCGREWEGPPAYRPAPGEASRSAHRCRRLDGHSSEHVCSCGARLDERLPLEVEQ